MAPSFHKRPLFFIPLLASLFIAQSVFAFKFQFFPKRFSDFFKKESPAVRAFAQCALPDPEQEARYEGLVGLKENSLSHRGEDLYKTIDFEDLNTCQDSPLLNCQPQPQAAILSRPVPNETTRGDIRDIRATSEDGRPVGTVLASYPPGAPNLAQAASGSKYAKLFLRGPNQTTSLRISLPPGAPVPRKVSFKVRLAKTYPLSRVETLNHLQAQLIVNNNPPESLFPSQCSTNPVSFITSFYVEGNQPVLDFCEYQTREIPLPGDFTSLSLEWRLKSDAGFYVTGLPCHNNRAEGCTFSPSAVLTIDDISFERPEAPVLSATRYELRPNEKATLQMVQGGLPILRDSPYQFRYVREGATDGERRLSRSGGRAYFSNATAGLYQVEGDCSVNVQGRRYDCGHTQSQANIWVRALPEINPPAAIRLTQNKVIVFPSEDRCFYTVNRYKVYRRDTAEGEGIEISPRGGIEAREMKTNGFVDEQFNPSQNPSYAIRADYEGLGEGARSNWAQTSLTEARPVVVLDHFPLPGDPTHFEVSWDWEQGGRGMGGIARDLRPPPTLLVAAETNSALGFHSGASASFFSGGPLGGSASDLYHSTLRYFALDRPPFRGKLTLADTNQRRGADGEMPELDDYVGLPIQHSFWVVGGDLAGASLTQPQLLTALQYMEAEQPPLDLSQCGFEGNRFVCTAPQMVPTLRITIPTLQIDLASALVKFYLDPEQTGGVLLSSQWKGWADNFLLPEIPNVSGNISHLSYLSSDPNNPILKQYAFGFATKDAIKMLQDNNNPTSLLYGCLPDFHIHCQYHTELIPYIHENFVVRYIETFLTATQRLGDQEAETVAKGVVAIMKPFFEPRLRTADPSLIQFVEQSVSLYIPDDPREIFGEAAAFWGDFWENTYKPYFRAFVRNGGDAFKALLYTAIEGYGFVVSELDRTHCAGMSGDDRDRCETRVWERQVSFEERLRILRQRLRPDEMADPNAALSFDVGEFLPAVLDMSRIGGVLLLHSPAVARYLIRMMIPLRVNLSPSAVAASAEEVIVRSAEVLDSSGNKLGSATITRNREGYAKIVEARGRSEIETAEAVAQVGREQVGGYEIVHSVNVRTLWPEEPLTQRLRSAELSGRSLDEAAECSAMGQGMAKNRLPKAEVTRQPDGSYLVRFGRTIRTSVEPVRVSRNYWPDRFADDPALVSAIPKSYQKVSPGTSFHHVDRDFDDEVAAIVYAERIMEQGIDPSSLTKRDIPVWNHQTFTNPCTVETAVSTGGNIRIGGVGAGPRSTWNSATSDPNDLMRIAILGRSQRYVVMVQGILGNRAVAYRPVGSEWDAEISIAGHYLSDHGEDFLKGRIPAEDIVEVQVFDRKGHRTVTGGTFRRNE